MTRNWLFAALALAFPMSAAAQELPAAPPPMPLEDREREDTFKKVLSDLEKLQVLADELVATKKNQCMKAFGNMQFCDCIVDKIPMSIDIVQYVSIVSGTKVDFKYNSMSAEDKKVFDKTRQARDACVQWQGKVEK